MSNSDDDLSIPDYLKFSEAERKEAWNGVALRPAVAFAEVRTASPETIAFGKAEAERKQMKTKARITKMLVKKAVPDPKTHRWDTAHNQWVQLRIYNIEGNMRPDFNKLKGPELVQAFNEMAVEAARLNIPINVVKRFATRDAGLRRCEDLYKAICEKKGADYEAGPKLEADVRPTATAPPKPKSEPKQPKAGNNELATACGVRENSKQYAVIAFLYDKLGKQVAETTIMKNLGVLAGRIKVAQKVMKKSKYEIKSEKDDKGETSYGLYSK